MGRIIILKHLPGKTVHSLDGNSALPGNRKFQIKLTLDFIFQIGSNTISLQINPGKHCNVYFIFILNPIMGDSGKSEFQTPRINKQQTDFRLIPFRSISSGTILENKSKYQIHLMKKIIPPKTQTRLKKLQIKIFSFFLLKI